MLQDVEMAVRNQFITFMTKTCKDVSIILKGDNITMITIGGENDTMYTISQDGVEKFTMTVANTTGCDQYQSFWLRWDGGVVEIGEGTLGNTQGIAMWKDPESTKVTDIGLSSGDSAAVWKFPVPGMLMLTYDIVRVKNV